MEALTPIRYPSPAKSRVNPNKRITYYIFKCYCGKEFKIKERIAKYKKIYSCGCDNKLDKLTKQNYRIYQIYKGMKQRCENQNTEAFKEYGAKGIIICETWKNSFEKFCKWSLKNGYDKNLTIDRINNKGNYSPNNCRWTTPSIQVQNTRLIYSTNTSGYRGVAIDINNPKKPWRASIGLNNERIWLGNYKCRLEAAYTYDNFIRLNKTEHPTNFKEY